MKHSTRPKYPFKVILFLQTAGSLLLTNQGNRWTSIYVHQVPQPNNVSYMLVGTETGHLIRALPPAKDWPQGIIISDTDVFDQER